MMTPYDNHTDWNIVAIKYKGTIYLAEYKTEAMHKKNEEKPEWVKRTMYWGRKVETYLTSDKPAGPTNQKEPVNENAEYTSVFRTKLGHVSILIASVRVEFCARRNLGTIKIHINSRLTWNLDQPNVRSRSRLCGSYAWRRIQTTIKLY